MLCVLHCPYNCFIATFTSLKFDNFNVYNFSIKLSQIRFVYYYNDYVLYKVIYIEYLMPWSNTCCSKYFNIKKKLHLFL